MFVAVGLNNADDLGDALGTQCLQLPQQVCCYCFLSPSEFCLCGVFSTIGNVLSAELCAAMLCS